MPREPSYAAQLGNVLRRRDVVALRSFLLQSARRFGDDRQAADVESKSDDEMEELNEIRAERDLWMARAEALAQPLFQKR